MIRHKAYKFRIYPNAEQQVLLAKTFGSVRFVYNYFLGVKTKLYEEEKKSLSYTKCAAELVSLKKENPFLKEVDSIALQQSLRHLLQSGRSPGVRNGNPLQYSCLESFTDKGAWGATVHGVMSQTQLSLHTTQAIFIYCNEK